MTTMMAEVRSIPGSGSGLFATKDYKVGNVIVEENSPLMKLAPSSAEQEERILAEFESSLPNVHSRGKKGQLKDDQPPLWSSIHPPSTVAQENHGKFKGMVQAALCYADTDVSPETKEKLLQLYHPLSTETDQERSQEEEAIVKISSLAVEYVTGLVDSKSKLHTRLTEDNNSETIQKVMLVWSCNSFDGGRVYCDISRINHSCNPNAVILHDNDKQTVVAAADIAVGEEISISYLGMLLYTERSVRQASLRQNKHFTCRCVRCKSMSDTAAAFPCPACHPRKHQLPEDVQYDDDAETLTVHYVIPSPDTEVLMDETQSSILDVLNCDASHAALNDSNKGMKNALEINRTVKNKITTFLQDHQAIEKSTAGDNGDGDDDEKEALQLELLEQHMSLASSVVGARHWATNLVLMMQLERNLQTFHANMLTEGADPDMEVLAEAIDYLERLCKFVQDLGLKLHIGHVLSDLVIGVARALVSLGDVKSQKYASNWLKRLAGYVEHFESDGIQKVVSTLQVAWTREAGGSQEQEEEAPDSNKRAKTS